MTTGDLLTKLRTAIKYVSHQEVVVLSFHCYTVPFFAVCLCIKSDNLPYHCSFFLYGLGFF